MITVPADHVEPVLFHNSKLISPVTLASITSKVALDMAPLFVRTLVVLAVVPLEDVKDFPYVDFKFVFTGYMPVDEDKLLDNVIDNVKKFSILSPNISAVQEIELAPL